MSAPVPVVISLTVLQSAAFWIWTWTHSVKQPKSPRLDRWMIHGMNVEIPQTLFFTTCQSSQKISHSIQRQSSCHDIWIQRNLFHCNIKCPIHPKKSKCKQFSLAFKRFWLLPVWLGNFICIEINVIGLDTTGNRLESWPSTGVLLALLLSKLEMDNGMRICF